MRGGMGMKYAKNPNNPAEQELAGDILDEWNAAIFTRQDMGIDEEWENADNAWSGDIGDPVDDDDPCSNTNVIQPNIESMISDLVDENAEINVTGYTKADSMFVNKAKAMLKWTWDNNDMILKQDDFERNKLNLGTGLWKVSYDPDFGINGLVIMEPEPIESIAVDPKITDYKKLQQADYIIQVSVRSLHYLRKRFGRRGRAVLPQSNLSFAVQGLNQEDAEGAAEVARNKAALFERFTKEEDGTLRLVYMANDVILFDSAHAEKYDMSFKISGSFYEHGMYPYVVVPDYKRKGTIYGYGDTRFLIPIQTMINELDDQIRYNAKLMGNIQVVVGLASGININSWTPTAGLRIPARDPGAFKVVQPPTMPGYIMERRNQGFKEAEIVSGRPDVVEGRSTGGADAAAAVMALQEAGNRRIKHKKKISNAAYKMLLKLVYAFCLEFYTEEQEYMTKDDKGIQHYQYFNAQDLNNIPQMEPNVDETTGYHTGWKEKSITKRAEFNLSLSMGQGLPNNKAFIYQSLIELKHADLITREEARTILKDTLGYTGFNPLNPIGAFDGPPNNQFKNSSPYNPANNPGPGAGAGLPPGVMPPTATPPAMPVASSAPPSGQPPITFPQPATQGAVTQGVPSQIDMNNPIVQQLIQALMQMQGSGANGGA